MKNNIKQIGWLGNFPSTSLIIIGFVVYAPLLHAQVTPATPTTILYAPSLSSMTGYTGGPGPSADCAINNLSKPNDGYSGGVGGSYGSAGVSFDYTTNSQFVNSVAVDSTTGIYNTVFNVMSLGGDGGQGGDGGSCYGGRGGGTGGAGGFISITNSASLNVSGSAIIAVSQGGMGGRGGNADSTYGAGDGGRGGAGGQISIINNNPIQTTGDYSPNSLALGIYGLSIGGDGGAGGGSNNVVDGDGGSGKNGGAGGAVSITNSSSVSTQVGYAIFGMSAGGYGGNAGNSSGFIPSAAASPGGGGDGGSVTITNNASGSLSTNGFGQAALVALSVGGGGGDAGRQSSIVEYGATGGSAGSGGSVIAHNYASINTNLLASPGIVALSVGGGGGMGGIATSAFVGGGGDGGGGGAGGYVEVVNTGAVCTGGGCAVTTAVIPSNPSSSSTTTNGTAPAITAMSVGGGGGVAGYSATVGYGFSVSIGGSGGDGGDGGKVIVSNSNTLQTAEASSPAIQAQSLGGGGGHAGGAFAASVGSDTSVAVAVGGTGGSGGDGGSVGVNCGVSGANSSSSAACSGVSAVQTPVSGSLIKTLASSSPGILAQSVGGGGGSGGTAVSLALGVNSSFNMSIGGTGGTGGAGGSVYANSNGMAITTSGEQSSGIEAQSIGGGGGHGGLTFYTPTYMPGGSVATAAGSFSIGGSGGTGGAGGSVLLEKSSGSITTTGVRSSGIYASSVGGGGGHGGLATSAAVGLGLSGLSFSIGGEGGSANKGGTVTVNNAGSITTSGAVSSAIEATSVGGGGGNGGWSVGSGLSFGDDGGSVTVGGTGGSGGSGGAVNVSNSGSLKVSGIGSTGILTLSVGGGGGNGGSSASADVGLGGNFNTAIGGTGQGGATGGAVTVTNSGTISTGVNFSTDPGGSQKESGIVAMSIGGGGGHGGVVVAGSFNGEGSITSAIGGGGGNGGTGGAVTITNSGSVSVNGALSTGIVGTSIGGRGGFGGIAVAVNNASEDSLTDSIGSTGGHGGTAGKVSITNNQFVGTNGFRGLGIAASSIGGNGGIGGISLGVTNTPANVPTSFASIGGSGGSGGVAEEASITNNAQGSVSTKGAFSGGLVAQSIGGEGGVGGIGAGVAKSILSESMTLGGTGGSGATGGLASITSSGSVSTSGPISIGILAQSIGGNGGLGGLSVAAGTSDEDSSRTLAVGSEGGSGANGGSATVVVSGKVSTTGILSTAVAAESIGGGGGRAASAITLAVSNLSSITSSEEDAFVGANGGTGGNGGSVSLTQNGGTVSTKGHQSDALYAGSIGGSGGSVGFTSINVTSGKKSFESNVGGQLGSTGNGGSVYVSANYGIGGSISTTGNFSDGLFAQSVGGGGGVSNGAREQSSPGGSYILSARMGGAGSGHGDGGDLTLYAGASINTQGYASTALFGQSIGGGGGKSLSGIFVDSGTVTLSIPYTNIQITTGAGSNSSSNGYAGTSSSSQDATAIAFSGLAAATHAAMQLGGYSSSKANGGDITVTANSVNNTMGDLSDGIKLQSIGNGGGFSAQSDLRSASPFAATAMFLGSGGNGGGDGGTITANAESPGATSTKGNLSSAYLAQSIGGGGGDARQTSNSLVSQTAAFASQLGVKAKAQGGSGGELTIENYGVLQTAGAGSDGLVAQSIGGGGGIAGMTGSAQYTSSAALESDPAKWGSVSAAGQNMSNVQTNSTSSSAYAGIDSGETNAGSAVSTLRGVSMASTLGASGGSSNNGNTVDVTNSSPLISTGSASDRNSDGSMGIVAQSIGAGGGIARAHLINFDQTQTSLAFMLGSTNNADGDSAAVTVSSNNQSGAGGYQITTAGRGAPGILAQSIGGGGGVALLTESTSSAGGSGALSMMLGSANSSHGVANSVTVGSGGIITTQGDQSQGIVAQSISNGGGVGKASIYASSSGTQWGTGTGSASWANGELSASGNSGLAASVQLGSNSSNGNNSADVTVTSSSQITTSGIRSSGIVAQTLGGGGGLVDITTTALNGGNLAVNAILAGSAPSNSLDATVSVTTTGWITTNGVLSDGILAQAIAAGGGSFGISQQGAALSGTAKLNAYLGMRSGDVETTAGTVSVTVGSDINTHGFGSSAVTAQSIGNGGGLLAYYVDTATTTLGSGGGGEVQLGSNTEYHGYGGTVTLALNANANTAGDHAPALIAQSIGAGGGRVVGNAQLATNTYMGSGLSASAYGYGGYGKTVTVSTAGAVATGGKYSPAIVAQSIGGGGGLIDFPVGNLTMGGLAHNNPYDSASGGGTVKVTLGGAINTSNTGSPGVVAQSIAGGGGFASQVTGAVTFGSATHWHANAGDVTVTNNASITTAADASPGIVATSIGGGGGVAILNGNQTVKANKGVGDAGDVTVNVNAPITTYGTGGSVGVIALSLAGGGGLIIDTNSLAAVGADGQGSSGTVTVNNNSSIVAHGAGTGAIWTGSMGGKNDPEVNMAPGSSAIGGPGGFGVHFSGGINILNNSGYISTADGVFGRAIESDQVDGTTTVNNNGIVTGGIQLAGSGNIVNNLSGGRMYLRGHAEIGSDGLLTNAGYLQFNPAGLSDLGRLHDSTGLAITQTSTGVLGLKFDHSSSRADLLSLSSGSRFNLAGNIKPVLINAGLIAPGSSLPTMLFQRNDGLLNVDELGVISTAIMTHGLQKDASGVSLSSTANFAPAGLSQFGSQVGKAIGDFQSAGSNRFFRAATAELVTLPDVPALDQAYQGLAGTAIQAVPQVVYQAVSQGIGSYSDRMNDWRLSAATSKTALQNAFYQQPVRYAANKTTQTMVDAGTEEGLIPPGRDGLWVSLFQSNASTDSLSDHLFGGSLGFEVESDQHDLIGGVGLTLSQSNYSYSSASTPNTPGTSTNVGLSIYGMKHHEQAYLSGVVYLGSGNSNFNRQLKTLTFATGTDVNITSYVAAARLEAGYSFEPFRSEQSNFKLTPFVAIQPTYIHQKSAQENFSAFGPGFNYAANDNTAVPVFAGLELSGSHRTDSGVLIHPFFRAAWMSETAAKGKMGANYSANQGVSIFYDGSPNLGNAMQYKLGALINNDQKVSGYVNVDYDYGSAGNRYHAYGANVGLMYAF